MSLPNINKANLGGFAIDYTVIAEINQILATGSKKEILEFGSGTGSNELCKLGKVHSVENDSKWLNKSPSHYIHAPLEARKDKNVLFPRQVQYYSDTVLRRELPKLKGKYGVVLVDGPLGAIGRSGILSYLNLLDTTVPFIFDDVHREDELLLAKEYARIMNKPIVIKDGGGGKHYAIVV
jgi:hypothetical protein